MNSNDPKQTPSPLSEIARNPDATARYLANVQRVLLDIGENLETLARETRLHLRGTHVEGDRRYHAALRARPVEKALRDVLADLNHLTAGLEKSAYKRRAHDEAVVNTARDRREKKLEKMRRKNPELQATPGTPSDQGERTRNVGYSNPASIYDLTRDRDSA